MLASNVMHGTSGYVPDHGGNFFNNLNIGNNNPLFSPAIDAGIVTGGTVAAVKGVFEDASIERQAAIKYDAREGKGGYDELAATGRFFKGLGSLGLLGGGTLAANYLQEHWSNPDYQDMLFNSSQVVWPLAGLGTFFMRDRIAGVLASGSSALLGKELSANTQKWLSRGIGAGGLGGGLYGGAAGFASLATPFGMAGLLGLTLWNTKRNAQTMHGFTGLNRKFEITREMFKYHNNIAKIFGGAGKKAIIPTLAVGGVTAIFAAPAIAITAAAVIGTTSFLRAIPEKTRGASLENFKKLNKLQEIQEHIDYIFTNLEGDKKQEALQELENSLPFFYADKAEEDFKGMHGVDIANTLYDRFVKYHYRTKREDPDGIIAKDFDLLYEAVENFEVTSAEDFSVQKWDVKTIRATDPSTGITSSSVVNNTTAMRKVMRNEELRQVFIDMLSDDERLKIILEFNKEEIGAPYKDGIIDKILEFEVGIFTPPLKEFNKPTEKDIPVRPGYSVPPFDSKLTPEERINKDNIAQKEHEAKYQSRVSRIQNENAKLRDKFRQETEAHEKVILEKQKIHDEKIAKLKKKYEVWSVNNLLRHLKTKDATEASDYENLIGTKAENTENLEQKLSRPELAEKAKLIAPEKWQEFKTNNAKEIKTIVYSEHPKIPDGAQVFGRDNKAIKEVLFPAQVDTEKKEGLGWMDGLAITQGIEMAKSAWDQAKGFFGGKKNKPQPAT